MDEFFGGVGDISFRTIDVLKDGELILCEDTRVSKKLISLLSQRLEIQFPNFTYISVHSHNEKDFLSQHKHRQLFQIFGSL